jgi:hypothetical protein
MLRDRSVPIAAWVAGLWRTAPLEDLYRFDRSYPADRPTIEHISTPWLRRPGSDTAALPLL